MKNRKTIITLVLLVIASILAFIFISHRNSNKRVEFETVPAVKGSIALSVTATGTVQAITTVLVGTQVSGVIKEIFVDFNTHVKKGQLLARLDETPLKAVLDQSRASVEAAEADFRFKEEAFQRNKILFDKGMIAKAEWEQAVYNYNTAKANLMSARATYSRNEVNLQYASIYSPIDGVVLSRAVDEGQTVAASFNTPTLFSIANDLTRMRVEANVDEADIGQVKLDQRVEFTVDAYPDAIFEGKVTQIRLQPVVTNNVVTYTIIIEAPNPELKLMPGMTASASIFISEKNDVITLSNRAIRFNPDKKTRATLTGVKTPRKTGASAEPKKSSSFPGDKKDTSAVVWLKKGDSFISADIETGITDGINTEIISGLKEGDQVAVSAGNDEKENNRAPASSPFMPRRPPPRR